MNERRHDTRFTHPIISDIKLILRPGNVVAIVDFGAAGARVDSRQPLRPGARVHLQLSTPAGNVRLSAHVLRCHVARIEGEEGVVYCGALRFDHRCDLPWERGARTGNGLPVSTGHDGQRLPHDVKDGIA